MSARAARVVDVQHEIVSGIDTYVLNTHHGNAVAVTVLVERGLAHDDPALYAGASHLFEHVIHRGSVKYPGSKTFDSQIETIGGSYNAYTDSNRTFYHQHTHEVSLSSAMDFMGAFISSPLLLSPDFLPERKVVIKEAREYQDSDDRSLPAMMDLHLLPKGHPLAKYDLGTTTQLFQTDVEQMRALHLSDYRPGSLSLIIGANLDGNPSLVNIETIVSLAQEHFKLDSQNVAPEHVNLVQAPAKEQIFPDYPSPDSPEAAPRIIEVSSPNELYTLLLRFQFPESFYKSHATAMELMAKYLTLSYRGSPQRILLDQGLINALDIDMTKLNNLGVWEVKFELTPEGAAKRYEIPKIIFEFLHNLSSQAMRADLFEHLKQGRINSHSLKSDDPLETADTFSQILTLGFGDKENFFDFETRFNGVSQNEIKELASTLMSPRQLLVGYMGPDVTGLEIDPEFAGRSYNLLPHQRIFSEWQSLLQNAPAHESYSAKQIEIPQVPLEFSDRPSEGPTLPSRLLNNLPGGLQAALREEHVQANGGIELRLQFAPGSARSEAAMRIFHAAFCDRYNGELEMIDSSGIRADLALKNGTFFVESHGNSLAVRKAVFWMMEKFSNFQPSDDEIARAKTQIQQTLLGALDSMAGELALGSALVLTHPHHYLSEEILIQLNSIGIEEVRQVAALNLGQTDVKATFSGDFTEAQARDLLRETQILFPQRLTERQRSSSKIEVQPQPLAHWRKLIESKSEADYGVSKAWLGPEPWSHDYNALKILQLALNRQVFDTNRGDNSLGYLAGVQLQPHKQLSILVFYGQTEGESNLSLNDAGWASVLQKIRDRNLSPSDFAIEKKAYLETMGILPSNEGQAAERMMMSLESTDNPRAIDESLADVRSLSSEEIYRVAEKYLLQQSPVIDVFASRNRPRLCHQILSANPTRLRRKIQREAP